MSEDWAMLNGGRRVPLAATVRVGEDTQVGRILAMVGDGSVQRKLIAAADHLIPSEHFPGMWECMNERGRCLGLVGDDAVHANTDLLIALARRKREAALEDEETAYTGRQVWAMVIGALILGAAAVLFGRG